MRSMKDWVFEAVRKTGYPLVFTDNYGIRSILYRWNGTPTWKLRGKYHMAKEFAAFKKLIPGGGVVLDVGANIGVHAIMMSRLAKKVYSFEPTGESFQHLKENIALNNADNITPILKAVSSKNGTATFHLFSSENAEWNSLRYRETPSVKPATERTVSTITLDTFAEEQGLEFIDFVKIDVEGAEKEVLMGASNLLKKHSIKALSFEVWGENQGGKTSVDELIGIFESFKYTVCDYDQKEDSFQTLSRPYTSQLNNDNLYAFPN